MVDPTLASYQNDPRIIEASTGDYFADRGPFITHLDQPDKRGQSFREARNP